MGRSPRTSQVLSVTGLCHWNTLSKEERSQDKAREMNRSQKEVFLGGCGLECPSETAQGMRKRWGAALPAVSPRTGPRTAPRFSSLPWRSQKLLHQGAGERASRGQCTEHSEQRRCREVRSSVLVSFIVSVALETFSCVVPYILLGIVMQLLKWVIESGKNRQSGTAAPAEAHSSLLPGTVSRQTRGRRQSDRRHRASGMRACIRTWSWAGILDF